MISYGYAVNLGYVLPLAVLQALLLQMSNGDSQWAAAPIPYIVPANDGDPRQYVAVGFTNPEETSNPNYLAYLFPLIARNVTPASPATGENLLACIHPKAARPLSRGLYEEEGDMKYDVIEDWERFWAPLKQALDTGSPVEFRDLLASVPLQGS